MGAARRALAAALLALAAVAAADGGAAHACSPAVPLEQMLDRAVLQAPVVAEAWIEAVAPRADLPSGIEDRYGSDLFVPVEIMARVVRVYKGDVVNPLVFYGYATRRTDGQVATRPNGLLEFPGSGSCLWPEADPSGKYALLVLAKNRQDRLVVNALSGTVLYDSPADVGLDADRFRVSRRIPQGSSASLTESGRLADASPDYARAGLAALPLVGVSATAVLALALVGRARPGGRAPLSRG